MSDFAESECTNWGHFLELLSKKEQVKWVYRGESDSTWSLSSSLERTFSDFAIDKKNAETIETHMIRDFRRQYAGPDRDLVNKDTLYSLALMQHHGAPTRLLDFTYSPFVAVFFAIIGFKQSSVWMINAEWLRTTKNSQVLKDYLAKRKVDRTRTDESFKPLFLNNTYEFVYLENPLPLNQRLIIQQGVFLCPGSIKATMKENIKKMEGWESSDNILRVILKFDKYQYRQALNALNAMNINSASLFPGLDGFARSLRERIVAYERISQMHELSLATPNGPIG